MGEYIYRLSGVKSFTRLEIEGRIEKVYHLQFWWKPGYDFMTGKDPYMPRNHGAMIAQLTKAFAALPVEYRDGEPLDPIRFVTDSKPGDPIHVYAVKTNGVAFSDCAFGGQWMPVVYNAEAAPTV